MKCFCETKMVREGKHWICPKCGLIVVTHRRLVRMLKGKEELK